MQIYIPKLHITGATFDCGKFGSAEVTQIVRGECLYDVDIHVSPSYRKTREEAIDTKTMIEDVISSRLLARAFEPDDTTNIELDVQEAYELEYLEY